MAGVRHPGFVLRILGPPALLAVFIIMQNSVGFAAEVLVILNFEYFVRLA